MNRPLYTQRLRDHPGGNVEKLSFVYRRAAFADRGEKSDGVPAEHERRTDQLGMRRVFDIKHHPAIAEWNSKRFRLFESIPKNAAVRLWIQLPKLAYAQPARSRYCEPAVVTALEDYKAGAERQMRTQPVVGALNIIPRVFNGGECYVEVGDDLELVKRHLCVICEKWSLAD